MLFFAVGDLDNFQAPTRRRTFAGIRELSCLGVQAVQSLRQDKKVSRIRFIMS